MYFDTSKSHFVRFALELLLMLSFVLACKYKNIAFGKSRPRCTWRINVASLDYFLFFVIFRDTCRKMIVGC